MCKDFRVYYAKARPRRPGSPPPPPPPPSRTNWTRLVPSFRINWTRLVPPSRTNRTRPRRRSDPSAASWKPLAALFGSVSGVIRTSSRVPAPLPPLTREPARAPPAGDPRPSLRALQASLGPDPSDYLIDQCAPPPPTLSY